MPTSAHQLHPARCRGAFSIEDVLAGSYPPYLIAEEKKDDVRYLFQIRPNGASQNFLTSRRISKVTGEFVEKQDKLPHFRDYGFPGPLGNTILDGGIHGDGISTDTVHDIAIGKGSYALWDVLFISGRDVRHFPYHARRSYLEQMKEKGFLPPWMELIPQSKNPKDYLSEILARKGEGLVLKDPSLPYGEGWFKVKEEKPYDVIIIGYEDSSSAKYAPNGWIKSVLFAQYVLASDFIGNDNLVSQEEVEGTPIERLMVHEGLTYALLHCGKTSGMTEQVRSDISSNRDENLGRVIEIEAQQRLKSGKFRHPRFKRFREDKNSFECIWDPNSEQSAEETEE